MRSALRSLLFWLDTRFPEKVIVTQAELTSIKGRLDALSEMWNKMPSVRDIEKRLAEVERNLSAASFSLENRLTLLEKTPNEDRIKRIEGEISKFNVSLGFAGSGNRAGAASGFQR